MIKWLTQQPTREGPFQVKLSQKEELKNYVQFHTNDTKQVRYFKGHKCNKYCIFSQAVLFINIHGWLLFTQSSGNIQTTLNCWLIYRKYKHYLKFNYYNILEYSILQYNETQNAHFLAWAFQLQGRIHLINVSLVSTAVFKVVSFQRPDMVIID